MSRLARVRRALLVGAALSLAPPIGPAAASHHTATGSIDVALPPMPLVSGAVHDIGVGGALPSDATCASRVRRTAESRPGNQTYNNTRGSSPNNENARVTGNFVGTTDEIIQWASCKWGLDLEWARAQALVESWWQQTTLGDFGTDASGCLPGHGIGGDGRPGQCPQSIGLLQVRYPYHRSAFEDNNAIRSSAYNADYAWSIWRRCFEGEYTWLNTVEHGRTYAAGDGLGCMGVWFSGRWYTDAAVGYMSRVSGTAPPSQAPSAPPGLAAAVAPTTGVGSGQVRLTWGAPHANGSAVTDYVLQQSRDGGVTWLTIGDGVNTNRSYLYGPITNGHTYRFRVAARNAVGVGPYSTIVSATPRWKPSAPVSLAAAVAPTAGVGSGQVRLTWGAPTSTGGSPITDYVLQQSRDGGVTWLTIGDGVNTNRSYLYGPITNGHTYRFRVAARNPVGVGPYSTIVSATPRATSTSVGVVTPTTSSTTTTMAASTTSAVDTSTTSAPTTTTGPTSTEPATSTSVAPSPVTEPPTATSTTAPG